MTTPAPKFDKPVLGVVGWKNSGKTTLAVRLIEEFSRRGLRVVTVKHAHHAFQIDEGTADSARHRHAGAAQVAIVSRKRWAMITELHNEDEPDFADVVRMLGPADLVIVEGYKSHPISKIEARRSASNTHTPIAETDPHVIAIAADHEITSANNPTNRPVFDLNDIAALADHVEKTLGLTRPKQSHCDTSDDTQTDSGGTPVPA